MIDNKHAVPEPNSQHKSTFYTIFTLDTGGVDLNGFKRVCKVIQYEVWWSSTHKFYSNNYYDQFISCFSFSHSLYFPIITWALIQNHRFHINRSHSLRYGKPQISKDREKQENHSQKDLARLRTFLPEGRVGARAVIRTQGLSHVDWPNRLVRFFWGSDHGWKITKHRGGEGCGWSLAMDFSLYERRSIIWLKYNNGYREVSNFHYNNSSLFRIFRSKVKLVKFWLLWISNLIRNFRRTKRKKPKGSNPSSTNSSKVTKSSSKSSNSRAKNSNSTSGKLVFKTKFILKYRWDGLIRRNYRNPRLYPTCFWARFLLREERHQLSAFCCSTNCDYKCCNHFAGMFESPNTLERLELPFRNSYIFAYSIRKRGKEDQSIWPQILDKAWPSTRAQIKAFKTVSAFTRCSSRPKRAMDSRLERSTLCSTLWFS